MMSVENVKRANQLLDQIERTQQLITAYREADEMTVGIPTKGWRPGQGVVLPGGTNMVQLTAAEIGDHVIAALERRVTGLQTELQGLGVA